MKDGWRWERGEDGALRRFSAKLWRWADLAALWPEPADMDTDGDRWEKEGGLWEADELDTALLRLVELVARASLSSRGAELDDGGSMMEADVFNRCG